LWYNSLILPNFFSKEVISVHITTRNVNSAFYFFLHSMTGRGHLEPIPLVSTSSRYGPVMMIPEPVIITYERPLERVLMNPVRDCNPFFHLFESLWMLAGRRDVAPVAYYNAKMKDFSDDGMAFNSPYGYRWREAFVGKEAVSRFFEAKEEGQEYPKYFHFCSNPPGFYWIDQLAVIIDQLKRKPDSRRCVLQIWSVEDDLLKIDATKDNACNTQAYFLINPQTGALDITVCNRSNDLIWGCLGANAVQFSFLLEYMAACIGVPVGRYHQVTNNLHYYTENPACPWVPEEWLAASGWHQPYDYLVRRNIPLVTIPERFDEEVKRFIDENWESDLYGQYQEPFLKTVAEPMCRAFCAHKRRDYQAAYTWLTSVAADDWQSAGYQWIQKRREGWVAKQEVTIC
jgi:thymidylate synthase